ncbi:MAG: hypothetical protein NXI19_04735 [Alphaproteobacteria bacterium]|nr:hypothetical protein [Alphaproteobacteria bacterium]
MARHITDRDTQRIIAIIIEWPSAKLTWRGLREVLQQKLGASWSYPTLNARPAIVSAFETKKSELRKALRDGTIGSILGDEDPEVEDLKQHIQKLELELRDKEKVIAAYDERFARYVYNAGHLKGLTPDNLNAPIPKIYRGQDYEYE